MVSDVFVGWIERSVGDVWCILSHEHILDETVDVAAHLRDPPNTFTNQGVDFFTDGWIDEIH